MPLKKVLGLRTTPMIIALHIQNLSIIESLQISFQSGLQVISGETGAGKSILLQAVSFAMGGKAEADSIRFGASEASVTLILDPSDLKELHPVGEELGIRPAEDGLFYLRRTLNAEGRSRAFLNDAPVTLKTLQGLGQACLQLVGQHAAQKLLEEKFLLESLDHYAGTVELLPPYRDSLSHYQEASRELADLHADLENSREQEEFLRFQSQELEKACLRDGEEEELEARKSRLKHKVQLVTQTYEMVEALVEGGDSLSDRLGKVLSIAEKCQTLDDSLQPVVGNVGEALAAVDAAGRLLHDYRSRLEEDPTELERIENRLALLSDLKRKFKTDEKGLIEKREELARKVSELENFDGLLEACETRIRASAQELETRAKILHQKRAVAAKKLSCELEQAFKALDLSQARVAIDLEMRENFSEFRAQGADQLNFCVSFNPGEDLRPLQEVISGGELSRLLLALYEILFPRGSLGSLIFDEVDAGVGGRVAELIGRKLETLSQKSQVICITHLPQIACFAAAHYVVEKSVHEGRTFSQIRLLTKPEREQEIARMLAGVHVTEQALKHARELLKNAAA